MTAAEIAMIITLITAEQPNKYSICINGECAEYIGTDPPYYLSLDTRIEVRTPGQLWATTCSKAGAMSCCEEYTGSSRVGTNSEYFISKLCVVGEGFDIHFEK